ncbi:hypothetical protein Q8W40_27845 [Vibrio penaeicida]|uniref:hypothetical protein n=1 Tax=Vibrio penaeicida TaxID=104609 RepID=UPI00273557A7|nr:hypothetical protein [Vibrio penaeicida]MDP2576016.1 hypothetical protein [Vibrio penaeicida]
MFEKLVHLINLLRPRFYNKLTWWLVGAGLVLVSQPLWEIIVVSLLNRYLDASISIETNEYLGLALIVVALLYHLVTTSIYEYAEAYKKRTVQNEKARIQNNLIEHDVNLYKKITESFNEISLNNYLSSVQDDHSYTSSLKDSVSEIIYIVDEVEFKFLVDSVDQNFIAFAKALNELMLWCACEFEPYPRHIIVEDQRYCMHPNLNGDRSGDYDSDSRSLYRSYSNTLDVKVAKVRESYKKFRVSVKRELYI